MGLISKDSKDIATGTEHSAGNNDERREHSRDLAGLISALDDADTMTRRWAARDLAAHPEAAPALIAHIEKEPDTSVRTVAMISLTEIGTETAVQGLMEYLRSEEAGLRNEAIEAMQQLPDTVAPIMSDLLRDPDSDVRIFAVNILESLKHPEVETWLIQVIEQDTHINVCATAVDLLGEIGSFDAVASLQQLKTRFAGEPYIQFAADVALKRIQESPA